jgi:hypothetical protein
MNDSMSSNRDEPRTRIWEGKRAKNSHVESLALPDVERKLSPKAAKDPMEPPKLKITQK